MGTLDHRLMSCSLIRTAALRHSGRAGRASRALCTADPNGVAAYEQRGQRLQPLMRAAVNRGLLPPATATNPMADFYDMDALDNRLNEMHQAFHEPFFTHCFAVKANPIRGILSRVVAAGGGLECASTGEVEHSRSLGAPTVIFDSPCKSRDQLRDVLVNMPEVYINLDNEQEMIDIEHILKEHPNLDVTGRIGLRINPVTGAGAIASVSTAGRDSKFGLPLVPETREHLLGLYRTYPWLQGLHIHVGSQGVSMEMLQTGATTLMTFVNDVESMRGGTPLHTLDIGGGLPTSYTEDLEAYPFAAYRKALEVAAPQIFSGKYRIITEFGRCVVTKPGITASRVAVVKGAPWHPETPLAVIHVGSNQFVREAYLGDQWRHRFTAFGSSGDLHTGASDLQHFDIAGPLCFQGDYVGRKHNLPTTLGTDDILVMHDTGGYTMAMYSRYNSRQSSNVYGYRTDATSADGFAFSVLKEQEAVKDTLAFWGQEEPTPV